MPTRLPTLLLAALLWGGGGLRAQSPSPALPPGDDTNAIDRRLAGKAAAEATDRIWYNNADFTNGTLFQWNLQLWCVDWDPYLTCFSPWNSNEHQYQAGTLLTRKHVLFSEHFSGVTGSNPLHVGDALCFVGLHGTLHQAKLKHLPERIGGSDYCLGTLDHDLTPDVIPIRVLPAGLPPDFLPPGTAVLFTNKNKEARVAEVASFGGGSIVPARAPNRVPWTLPGPAAVGDSGSPVFVIVDDRPVLWWLFHTPGSGDPVSNHLREIEALLEPGYKLDVAPVKSATSRR